MNGNDTFNGERTSLWRNARLATLEDLGSLGIVEKAAVAIRGERIVFAGAESELPADLAKADQVIDCDGRWITPALIDCHTHLVHGGNRAREFELRLEGATYEDIARAGGGIVSTVKATNALSVDELVQAALPRLDALLAEGVSTVEIKSGYGLNIEAELKMLRAARVLGHVRPVRVVTSYLAAHATPPEYKGRHGDYIADVVLPGLARAHAEGLVDAVDGFCEGIAFSPAEIATVFDRARSLGLPVKLHAEQLSNLGGARLAASYGALSADHLEYLDAEGAAAMAKAGTVAVLLPGAFYTLREKQLPPVEALRTAGTRIAVATDCNPGTSPLTSLLMTMNMAATLFRLTLEECLAGVTREAARALGILDQTGTIEPGKSADLAIWDIETPAELIYRIGFNPLSERIFKGKRIPR
ncbi:imidazolonepropionase [Sinorhizobium saheli]|uniref:Imidazolonepropionase n=1 Tax=Sinorhizobium saheli TaxID=36856 RepID=A0A178Y479_SINSA|nr:imidazolonepropionase [Sinorhizobium saheli]MQW88817.1 imidazolonepropionase [Sinorhizobium saheli]OAP42251.1 imidazolonepropionase [Sinorhizobium saheli]